MKDILSEIKISMLELSNLVSKIVDKQKTMENPMKEPAEENHHLQLRVNELK